jgi:hypothetical protein
MCEGVLLVAAVQKILPAILRGRDASRALAVPHSVGTVLVCNDMVTTADADTDMALL